MGATMAMTSTMRRTRAAEEDWISGPSVVCQCGALVPLAFASRFATMTLIPCPKCGAEKRFELPNSAAVLAVA